VGSGFLYDTVDQFNNAYEGWFIDNILIQSVPVTEIVCPEDLYEPNDIPDTSHAKKLSYGVTVDAAICPGTDIDYFRFDGKAGDRIVVDIDAKSAGSALDGYLFLLDTDGYSELAENDDEVLYEKQDPLLEYILPRDGEYYLKFQAWDHPMGNGQYTMKLFKDDQDPTIKLKNPIEGSSLPIGSLSLAADASDAQSGVRFVRFMVHTSNWLTGKWTEAGTDYNGEDGWSATFDTSSLPDGDTISVYAFAYDRSGNWNHAAAWNVDIDARPLSLSLPPLLNPAQSTAIHLEWLVTGGGSETAMIDVQQKVNGGAWADLLVETDLGEYWIIGEPENTYTYRVFARDYAGNELSKQTTTSIPNVTTLCSQPDSWDLTASDNDNGYETATELLLFGNPQRHNFCNPKAADYLNDEDWFHFSVVKGGQYVLIVQPKGDGSAAVTTQFYAADARTLLARKSALTYGRSTQLYWTAPEDGTIFVRLTHNFGEVAGNAVVYNVLLSDGSVFLPHIKK